MGNVFAKVAVGFVAFVAVSYVGNTLINGKRNEESKEIIKKLLSS